jgi:hypothetical protein
METTEEEVKEEELEYIEQQHGSLNSSWASPANVIIKEVAADNQVVGDVLQHQRHPNHQKVVASDELADKIPLMEKLPELEEAKGKCIKRP